MYEGCRAVGGIERALYRRNLTNMNENSSTSKTPEALFVTAEANGAALLYQDTDGVLTCLGMTFGGHCKLIELALREKDPEYYRRWAKYAKELLHFGVSSQELDEKEKR